MNSLVLHAFFKEAESLQVANMPKRPPPKNALLAGAARIEKIEKKQKLETAKNVLKPVDTARPYAHRALMGALPGGWLGGWASTGPKIRMARGIGATTGAALAMGDKHLETLSKRREFKKVLKSYHEPLKKSAMPGSLDMRTRVPGLKKTPFATTGSKNLAQSGLNAGNKAFSSPSPTGSVAQQAVRV